MMTQKIIPIYLSRPILAKIEEKNPIAADEP
jgi:hypothetical protein